MHWICKEPYSFQPQYKITFIHFADAFIQNNFCSRTQNFNSRRAVGEILSIQYQNLTFPIRVVNCCILNRPQTRLQLTDGDICMLQSSEAFSCNRTEIFPA